jgi:SOS response regulatory protein OraA/RecX
VAAPAAPVLTGLAPDPRQPEYQLVEVDRGRLASLPAQALATLKLVVGQVLEPAVLARLRELAQREATAQAALRALARRSYAAVDLRRHLLWQRHPAAFVDATLERLAGRGLIDDRRHAEQYAAVHAARGHGPARLVHDLRLQGVERRTAEQAVRQALEREGFDPAAVARAVAVKRARLLGTLPQSVRRRRLRAFLVRRGFTGPQLGELVRELCG